MVGYAFPVSLACHDVYKRMIVESLIPLLSVEYRLEYVALHGKSGSTVQLGAW